MLRAQNAYRECDTLFYQGANCTQTQALKYTGNQKIVATTGELMWSTGRNNLAPLQVIYNLHIGTEIADVNLNPFDTRLSYLNPVKLFYSGVSWAKNYWEGVHIEPAPNPTPDSVVFHSQYPSLVSYGQEPDIQSHYLKYQAWLDRINKNNGLILWGVSRGTAATFCAFARYKYPEVKLVVLEGAIDSVANIARTIAMNTFRSERAASYALGAFRTATGFLHKFNLFGYSPNGVSPIDMVNEFPENIPVVFVTSKKDSVVPAENTENIAKRLAERGKNDVYVLRLENSSHPNYMYDDKNDRDIYEAFIHAVYRKYGLQHDHELADKGEPWLEKALIKQPEQRHTLAPTGSI